MEKAFINIEIDFKSGKSNIKAEGTTIQKLSMLSELIKVFESGEITFEDPTEEYTSSLHYIFHNADLASIILDAAVIAEIKGNKKVKIF